MNQNYVFLLLIFIISSTTAYQQNVTPTLFEPSQFIDDSFDIQLQMNQVDKDHYNLEVALELGSGSYVVSPFSQDEIYGHFDISIPNNNSILPVEELIENPRSVAEYDAIIKEPVHLVRGKTTYKQKIEVIENGDFEVKGLIWFVLEPSCVPYDVEFKISRNSGKMEVSKISTAISAGYKQ